MDCCIHKVNDLELKLLPDKAIYIGSIKTLIVTDIHLGKTGHFRKAGMPIPSRLATSDLERLSHLIKHNEIEKLIVLGDMFHAQENTDMKLFSDWRIQEEQIEIILVRGNHDILPKDFYIQNKIEETRELFLTGEIKLVHRFNGVIEENIFTISGHVHPAVRLHGKGRQRNIFKAFYFTEHFALMPAFGEFTGNYIINPSKHDTVFVITNNGKILKV